ncbi:hypothetical protein MLD38_004135 [Melastoma candidum]|uniref:Uncharacterized protein n=1 Tax=Melastoma candidum TaxID=119954 RepID=A0ACB9S5H3_9MYRT|nr:hypothetical protein MLD38_004135 [Melastoma candidum]
MSSQLGSTGKPLGSMNLDEFLKNVSAAERNQGKQVMVNGNGGDGVDRSGIPTSPLQRQTRLRLGRELSGRTANEVWMEIQLGQRRRSRTEALLHSREQMLEELPSEDLSAKTGLFTDMSLSSSQGSETVTVQMPKAGLEATSSAENLPPSSSYRRNQDDPDPHDSSLDRRLKRKIKNRESAARSRARKQAYHSELVTKVSQLEEDNMKLKKEKEFDAKFPGEEEAHVGSKYQLRRTSSASL